MDPITFTVELEIGTLVLAAVGAFATLMHNRQVKARRKQLERHHLESNAMRERLHREHMAIMRMEKRALADKTEK